MTKSNLDLGNSFDKMKKDVVKEEVIEYGLKRLELTDMLTLTRNGKPILAVPDELAEDFIYLIVRTKGFDRFQAGEFFKETENDIPPSHHCQPGLNNDKNE